MPTGSSAHSTVADALSRFRAGEAVDTPVVPTPAPQAQGKKKEGRIGYPIPNGNTYYARSVPGLAGNDVQMLRMCRGAVVSDNIYVLAHGDPGTGKSMGAWAAFPDAIIFSGDADTTVDDLLGTWVQNPDGTYSWVDGPWVIAAEQGKVIIVDEIAHIPTGVMMAAYPLMDDHGAITIKANPKRGTVHAKPGFYVVGTCNPNAPGARMSEALLSRFTTHIEATTDYDLAKSMGVPAKLITAAKNLATKKANGEVRFALQMRELLAFKRNADRMGLDFAVSNAIGIAPASDRPVVADVLSRAFGAAAMPLRLGNAAMQEEEVE